MNLLYLFTRLLRILLLAGDHDDIAIVALSWQINPRARLFPYLQKRDPESTLYLSQDGRQNVQREKSRVRKVRSSMANLANVGTALPDDEPMKLLEDRDLYLEVVFGNFLDNLGQVLVASVHLVLRPADLDDVHLHVRVREYDDHLGKLLPNLADLLPLGPDYRPVEPVVNDDVLLLLAFHLLNHVSDLLASLVHFSRPTFNADQATSRLRDVDQNAQLVLDTVHCRRHR